MAHNVQLETQVLFNRAETENAGISIPSLTRTPEGAA